MDSKPLDDTDGKNKVETENADTLKGITLENSDGLNALKTYGVVTGNADDVFYKEG